MYYEKVRKIFAVSFIATLLLLITKILAGYFSKSLALIYDGFESAADIILFISLYGATLLAAKPPDSEHQYGHTKIENLASLFLGLAIFAGGIALGFNAFSKFLKNIHEIPSWYSFFVAITVVAVKESLYFYTKKRAVETKSPVLEALAIDHHKDALSSIITVIGTASSFLKAAFLDILAAFITAIVISFIGLRTAYSSSSDLLDRGPDPSTMETIKNAVSSVNGVKKIARIKARKSGKDIYVDIDIEVDKKLTVEMAHEIASRVQEKTSEVVENVKDVVVHVEPHSEN
ncbi:MAG: cation diffusion facilitator family transporter [Actinobacteria bacterium]|nr:cation diffusion facilitator family transporter [Actinomycetota bacterium]